MKPKVLVFSGYGLNCEEETKYAFELAGAKADIIHINDLIEHINKVDDYEIMAFPGGFSYGDDTGSGNAYANRLRNHLWDDIDNFVQKDKLVIGICNGFQILVNLGLLPALKFQYGARQAALMHNDSARYVNRWVDIKIQNDTPWFAGIKSISLPIAHGEGKFYTDSKTLKEMKKQQLIAGQYYKGEICKLQRLPTNPNGTLENIAAITDESKRVLGMMPHPERGIMFTHLPHWTYLKEEYKRKNKKIEEYTSALTIFKNAVQYFE